MAQGIYVPAEGKPEKREFACLEDYQAAVGGLIEAVDVPVLGITIYVNDEGLLRHLPFNSRASFLWWHYVPAARQAMLVGDAVIVGMPDKNGENTDVPEEARQIFTVRTSWAILIRFGNAPLIIEGSQRAKILLPLTNEAPYWCLSLDRHDDFFSATVWAQLILERVHDAVETKVVRAGDLEDRLQAALH